MSEPTWAHLTARALPGTLLFHDWTEALELWRRLRRAFPEAAALCLMPNHPHVITELEGSRARMSGVMSGYARWRGARRGQEASCWQPQPPPEPLADAAHRRRSIRYVLLNPCRGGLVNDPLAWPLSTHRDLVGLGDPRLKVRDPEAFHAYISGDPSVAVDGTPLPPLELGAPLPAIEAAVGAVLRMTPAEVRASPEGRRQCLRAGAFAGGFDTRALAAWMGVDDSVVYRRLARLPSRRDLEREPILLAVLRAAGDPRFAPLALPARANPTRWDGWRLTPTARKGA